MDDLTQARALGELQWAPDTRCMQLGDLLTGRTSFARKPEDITIFDMTGLALQDLLLGEYLYQAAQRDGAGVAIHWPW